MKFHFKSTIPLFYHSNNSRATKQIAGQSTFKYLTKYVIKKRDVLDKINTICKQTLIYCINFYFKKSYFNYLLLFRASISYIYFLSCYKCINYCFHSTSQYSLTSQKCCSRVQDYEPFFISVLMNSLFQKKLLFFSIHRLCAISSNIGTRHITQIQRSTKVTGNIIHDGGVIITDKIEGHCLSYITSTLFMLFTMKNIQLQQYSNKTYDCSMVAIRKVCTLSLHNKHFSAYNLILILAQDQRHYRSALPTSPNASPL